MRCLPCLVVMMAAVLPAAAAVADDDHREHGAHVHGMAGLNLAIEGHEVVAELISPAMNLVGFEHPPRDAEERETVRRAVAALEDAGNRLILPAPAACRLESVRVESALLEGAGDDEHAAHEETGHDHEEHDDHQDDHQDDHGDAHAEFEVRYAFHCDAPGEISHIEVALFEAFPGMEKIALQVLTEAGQTGGELAPGDNIIRLGD